MTFEESMQYITSFNKFGIKLGLERISALLEHLGHPERNIKFVHVAGTNGKGSVSIMIESVLRKAGYKVGLFTSPHLERYSERIKVNGVEIGEDDLNAIIQTIIPKIEQLSADSIIGTPTEFEVCTAVCFEYFKRCDVEIAVVEVGLGGRFDSTNVITPIVSVITQIGMDHIDRLGTTIEKIALEKAGILKKGIPAVIAPQTGVVLDVIRNVAENIDCPLFLVQESVTYEISKESTDINGMTVDIFDNTEKKNSIFKINNDAICPLRFRLKMLGVHQGYNAACAFSVIKVLKNQGFEISEEALLKGMEESINPGRLEVVQFEPLVVLDGAHNLEGIKALVKSIKQLFLDRRILMVCGFSLDKPYKKMIKELGPYAEEMIMTTASQSRVGGVDIQELVNSTESFGIKCIGIIKAGEAVKYALEKSKAYKKSMILICGSLYLIGEVRNIWKSV